MSTHHHTVVCVHVCARTDTTRKTSGRVSPGETPDDDGPFVLGDRGLPVRPRNFPACDFGRHEWSSPSGTLDTTGGCPVVVGTLVPRMTRVRRGLSEGSTEGPGVLSHRSGVREVSYGTGDDWTDPTGDTSEGSCRPGRALPTLRDTLSLRHPSSRTRLDLCDVRFRPRYSDEGPETLFESRPESPDKTPGDVRGSDRWSSRCRRHDRGGR